MKRMIAMLSLMLALSATAQAQDLVRLVQSILQSNSGYLQPAVDAYGSMLNGGMVNSASTHDFLGIDFGVRGMWAIIPSSKLTYDGVPPATINGQPTGYPATVKTATIFGGQGSIVSSATNPNMPRFPFPDGLNLKNVGLAVPQLSVGIGMGTDFMIRYVPPIRFNTGLGNASLAGVGLKHSISQYLPIPIFDVAVHGAVQTFSLNDSSGATIIKADAATVGLILSTRGDPISFYLAGAWESSKMNLTYNAILPGSTTPTQLKYDLSGSNRYRATIGMNIKLLIINANIDYTFADTPMLTAGASLTIR